MIHLVIFASGSGTNAEKIMEAFEFDHEITVSAVFTNKSDAGVIKRAEDFGVPVEVFDKAMFVDPTFGRKLDMHQADYLILAGFLWKVPGHLVTAYPDKILNIHPALLPKYGGKGMFGHHVHQAVLENGERESGITIHKVNENYDEGQIIFQAKCDVAVDDTSSTLAQRIHALEHKHFPEVIREYVLGGG